MQDHKPIVYLLCGLPGSGKTTYAKKIENDTTVRLTLDEELFRRYGKDFPKDKYPEYEEQTKSDIKQKAEELVREGKSVIIDFGFWKKRDRDAYKEWAASIGATPKLVYLKVDEEELLARTSNRNIEADEHTHHIPESLMRKFMADFEEPSGEGEIVEEKIS